MEFSERTAKFFGCIARLGGVTPYAIGAFLLAVAAYVLYTATPCFGVSGG